MIDCVVLEILSNGFRTHIVKYERKKFDEYVFLLGNYLFSLYAKKIIIFELKINTFYCKNCYYL